MTILHKQGVIRDLSNFTWRKSSDSIMYNQMHAIFALGVQIRDDIDRSIEFLEDLR